MTEPIGTLSSYSTSGSGKENAKIFVQSAAQVVEDLVPHFEIAIKLATLILETFDKAKSNKKICRVLADRVDLALTSIKHLRRHIDNDYKKFQEKSYFESFLHFIEVLEKIKNFVVEISEINGFKKYFVANLVNKELDDIRDDFDHCYKALQLAISVDGVVNREKEDDDIKVDLNRLREYFECISDDIKRNFNLTDEKFSIITAKIENLEKTSSISDNSRPPNIDEKNILDTDTEGPVYRGDIVLKKYKNLDVACKKIKYPIDDNNNPGSKKAAATLAIWNELGDCPYIIRFLGTSIIDVGNVMVLEWAEFGNLKELYEKKNYDLKVKLSMVRDIFRGLCFLNHIRILHHDVRCENILVTEKLQCKISNFTLSRRTQYVTTNKLSDTNEVDHMIRWMAPEKLKSYQKSDQQNAKIEPYTYACEMFSFGMLLWELSFNREPYKGLKYHEIIDHVMSEKRETLDFGDGPRDIIDGFTRIITSAWQHDFRRRPTNPQVIKLLESLYRSHYNDGNTSIILNGETNSESVSQLEIPQKSSHTENITDSKQYVLNILPLSIGIEFHHFKAKKTKAKEDYKFCWECFKAHADMGNKTAKYWKGLYLWEGYVEKDQIEAKKLFKEAADAGIADAQVEYAFAYDSKNLKNPDLPFNKEVCWEYLNKAAVNEHPTALYHLGNSYYNGKMGVHVNKEKGIEYLKLAALQDNPKAIKALATYGINL